MHPHVIVLVIHVINASIWLGSTFFVAWFLMPAIQDIGPDGGKVMAAVQKRGWIAVVPIIATLTVLSGLWLLRQYMGAPGTQAKVLNYGGLSGLLAYVLGIAVVSRSLSKATGLAQKLMTMPDGPEKKAALGTIQQHRQRATLFARIVSLLIILAAMLMTTARYL